MSSKQAMTGPGMSWTPGVWFGAGHAGCTAWMLTGAVEIAFMDRGLSIVFLACFLIANAVGLGLWMRRDRIAPYPALQRFLLVIGIVSALALLAIYLLYPKGIPQGPGRTEQVPYPALLIVPLLMALLHVQEKALRGANTRRMLVNDQGVKSLP